MADNPSKRDERDRSQVAGGEEYEIDYFAKEAGISQDQARELVRKHGNKRETLMAEARKLSK